VQNNCYCSGVQWTLYSLEEKLVSQTQERSERLSHYHSLPRGGGGVGEIAHPALSTGELNIHVRMTTHEEYPRKVVLRCRHRGS